MTFQFVSKYREYRIVLDPSRYITREDGSTDTRLGLTIEFKGNHFKTEDAHLAARLRSVVGFGTEFLEIHPKEAVTLPPQGPAIRDGARGTVPTTPVDPLTCQDCGQTYANKGAIARHRSVKHDPKRAAAPRS